MVRLKLNACASGASISALTSLRSLMLITRRSVLDLLASILMVSPTWHGPLPAYACWWYTVKLGYWFLQWKKVIESVRDFGTVCGRDTFYRDFRDSGVSRIEIGCLFEKFSSFSMVFN